MLLFVCIPVEAHAYTPSDIFMDAVRTFVAPLFSPIVTSRYPDQKTFIALPYLEQMRIIQGLAKHDPAGAWRFLGSTEETITSHSLGHIIGNALFKKYGTRGITFCTPQFLYSCYHGFMETYLAQKGLTDPSAIERVCTTWFSADTEEGSNSLNACIHGAGHGLVSYYGYDIERAVSTCHALSVPMQLPCYNGVFMVAPLYTQTNDVRGGAWKLCENITLDLARESCERQAAGFRTMSLIADSTRNADGIASISNEALARFTASCSDAPTISANRRCVETAGHIIGSAMQNATDIKDICSSASAELRRECMVAAASEWVLRSRGEKEAAAKATCDYSKSDDEKTHCVEIIERAATLGRTLHHPEELDTFSPRPYEQQ